MPILATGIEVFAVNAAELICRRFVPRVARASVLYSGGASAIPATSSVVQVVVFTLPALASTSRVNAFMFSVAALPGDFRR